MQNKNINSFENRNCLKKLKCLARECYKPVFFSEVVETVISNTWDHTSMMRYICRYIYALLFLCCYLFYNGCYGKERLEDPKDIRSMNAHRRIYYEEAEFTDLGSEYVSGSVWPKPQSETRSKHEVFTLNPKKFVFKSHKKHEILENAFQRYKELTFPYRNFRTNKSMEEIKALQVTIDDYKQPLSVNMNETYTLKIKKSVSTLHVNSIWGALRGLETFSQIVFFKESSYQVFKNTIVDFPRFPYRGFLIDTSRHFLPVPKILQFINAMAYSKFNALHWHIVDFSIC